MKEIIIIKLYIKCCDINVDFYVGNLINFCVGELLITCFVCPLC